VSPRLRRALVAVLVVVGLGWVVNWGLCTERVTLVDCSVCLPDDANRCGTSLTDALRLTSEDAAKEDARRSLCYSGDGGLLHTHCLERPLTEFRTSCTTRVVSRSRIYLGPT